MLELAGVLATPIAKLLLKSWLGDTSAEVGTGLLEIGLKKLGERGKAAEAQGKALAIATAVARDLEKYFNAERADTGDLAAAADALATTIEQYVDAEFLVSQGLEVSAIESALLGARPVDRIYGAADPACAYYRELVRAIAPRLRAVAPELPEFALEQAARVLEQLGGVAERADEILATVRRMDARQVAREGVEADREADFLSRYLGTVVDELDYVELLGLKIDAARRRAPLSVAYLSLSADLGAEGRRIGYPTLLELLPALGNRLLIEGAAGSGKSTLIRWTAIEAARAMLRPTGASELQPAENLESWLAELIQQRPEIFPRNGRLARQLKESIDSVPARLLSDEHREDLPLVAAAYRWLRTERKWQERIPFLIQLREHGRLPSPEELPGLIGQNLRDAPHPNWVSDLLRAGRGLLMFDGLDEVPRGLPRQKCERAIERYLQDFPSCQFIVAGRPGSIDRHRLGQIGFVPAAVNDLLEEERSRLVHKWHDAIGESSDKKWGERRGMLVGRLLREFERNRELARLATNPLLCTAICALHELGPDTMPRRDYDICDQLTLMLIDRRDREEGETSAVPATVLGPIRELREDQKRSLLSHIAYGFVVQRQARLPRARVVPLVEAALPRMDTAGRLDADSVLTVLEERSGVLRGTGPTELEFHHSTFRDFLAALRFLALGAPMDLSARVDEPALEPVILFAASAPDRSAYVEPLVEDLFADLPPDLESCRAKVITAIRCAIRAQDIDKKYRQQAQRALDAILPLQNYDEASSLAELGDPWIVPSLGYRSDISGAAAAAAVHCLRLVGTVAAAQCLEAWKESNDLAAAEGLVQMFHPLTLRSVILAAQDFEGWHGVPRSVRLRIRDLEPLRELTALRVLNLDGTQLNDAEILRNLRILMWLALADTQVSSVEPLAGLTLLQWLDLSRTPLISVEPLRHLDALTSLYLTDTPVRDIGALRDLNALETLFLSGSPISSVEPLACLAALRMLSISRTSVSSVEPLKSLTALEWLTLFDTRVGDLGPLRELAALRELNLAFSSVRDVTPLQSLAGLQVLTLTRTAVTNLQPLEALGGLRELNISNTAVNGLEPLRGLADLHTLSLSNTQVKSLEPLRGLTALETLNLSNSQVSSVEPLEGLCSLRELDLSGTQVQQSDPIVEELWRRGVSVSFQA